MTKLYVPRLYEPAMYRVGVLLVGLLLSASIYAGADGQAENTWNIENNWRIEDAWTRATAPGQDTAGVDFSITSKRDAKLLGVTSTASSTVEMHSMTHENGVMKMREVEAIELPAGQRVNLGESGYHLMLIGLKAPLKPRTSIPLTLTIKAAKRRTVKIKVRAEVKPLATTKATTQ